MVQMHQARSNHDIELTIQLIEALKMLRPDVVQELLDIDWWRSTEFAHNLKMLHLDLSAGVANPLMGIELIAVFFAKSPTQIHVPEFLII
jgi:hypothetical protein